MKGLVLAAGLGTRLRPLTDRLPKPLIPVLGRPCVERILTSFAALGIADVAINTHHLPEALHAALGDGANLGVRLHWQHEPALLDGCGTLRSFDWLFGDEPVLCANGDFVHDLDLPALLAAHRESGALLSLSAAGTTPAMGWDADGWLRAIRNVGWDDPSMVQRGDFNGFLVAEPAVWREWIPPGVPYHLSLDLCPRLLAAGVPVHVHATSGLWAPIGTRAELDAAAALLLQRRCARYLLTAEEAAPGVFCEPH
ncbi:MAG: NTP transferase domain-containing protein, partial [Rubrivivax sp.]|nr:NTP transferase domain-containing protein [Rubrivivax sp.]